MLGEEVSRVSEDGVTIMDPKRRHMGQEIKMTSGEKPMVDHASGGASSNISKNGVAVGPGVQAHRLQ